MTSNVKAWLDCVLARWHRLVCRHAIYVVVLAICCAASSAVYIARNLDINTDTADLLSAQLPWRAAHIAYERAFPQYGDTIAIVIEAATPDQVGDAVARLHPRLIAQTEVFDDVYLGQFAPFFRRNGLLYLDLDSLEDMADRLARMQPFLAHIAAQLSLRNFAQTLSMLVDALATDHDIQLDETFAALASVFDAAAQNRKIYLSWQELLLPTDANENSRRAIIVVKPKLDFSLAVPAERAITTLRASIANAGLISANGFRVRLSGSAALAYEELGSVTRGAQQAAIAALLMVAIILGVGLRSLGLVVATLLSLIFGLIYTAAFAAFAVEELNLISVTFAVLYIGLGVDFAIHYCLRYAELCHDRSRAEALAEANRHLAPTLAICAATTAIGFFSFLPTAYLGVAELGLISGTGMFICLGVSVTVLPALLSLLPPPRSRGPHAEPSATDLPGRYARPICTGMAFAVAAGLLTVPFVEFDHNPIHLQDPTTEAVSVYRDLLAENKRSPLSIVAMIDGRAQAIDLAQRLQQLPEVVEVLHIADFVPARQHEKIEIIETMALVVGPDFTAETPVTAARLQDDRAALQKLADDLRQLLSISAAPANTRAIAGLSGALDRYLAPTSTPRLPVDELRDALLSNLPGRLDALSDSLDAYAFSETSLPDELYTRWVATPARYRIEVFPRDNLDDNVALERFVAAVRGVAAEHATGDPIINLEASKAVVGAFQQALVTALVAITILLFFLLPRRTDVLLILVPLAAAGLLTSASAVVLGLPFNFANIIALPLLLGIGVDGAIHILHRHRDVSSTTRGVLGTSTARAVTVSALTTACGFGNLAASGHPGTASMGVMLAIGLAMSLLCTLLFLPALLALCRPAGSVQTGEWSDS